ncbi:MAG: ribosome recycling factor, partial [Clostridia bacterium]
MNEMVAEYMDSYKQDLNKIFDKLEDEFSMIRVGRANPKIVEKIMVEYYGSRVPLSQAANISVPEARMLLVSPWDSSLIKGIKSSIDEANLGVSCSDDGQKIRIIFPQLTEERRVQYSKDARKTLENYKITMRNARRDILDVLKEMKKDAEISEDEYNTLDKSVQKFLDEATAKADTACDKKVAE